MTRILIALLALAAGLAASPLPGVGAGDPRHTVDGTTPPWTAIARLNVTGIARCTAFLIAPRTALTAAHCLYGRALGHFVPPGSIHVLTRYSGGGFARHGRVTAYHIAPGYDPNRPDQTRGADIAELTLDTPMIDEADALTLARFPPPPGTPVMLGGYNQDRAEIIEADTTCHIRGRTQDGEARPLLAHDCTATRGTSGAPLLVNTQGHWQAAGVNVAAATTHAGGVATLGVP